MDTSQLVNASDNYTLCLRCKKLAYERCFTAAGYREVGISGMCELCFDIVTQPPLDDDQARRMHLLLDKETD
jgi:hypothetical protein